MKNICIINKKINNKNATKKGLKFDIFCPIVLNKFYHILYKKSNIRKKEKMRNNSKKRDKLINSQYKKIK